LNRLSLDTPIVPQRRSRSCDSRLHASSATALGPIQSATTSEDTDSDTLLSRIFDIPAFCSHSCGSESTKSRPTDKDVEKGPTSAPESGETRNARTTIKMGVSRNVDWAISPTPGTFNSTLSDDDRKSEDQNPSHVDRSALHELDAWIGGCSAEDRFSSQKNKCLANKLNGQRCRNPIARSNETMIGCLLADLKALSVFSDFQKCVHQLGRLADLAVCHKHRQKMLRKIELETQRYVFHNSRLSVTSSDGASFGTEHSEIDNVKIEMTEPSAKTCLEKQDIIPDEVKKGIQSITRKTYSQNEPKHALRKRRSTPSTYISKFIQYQPISAAKSSAALWLALMVQDSLTPSERLSGFIYVYWNEVNFGHRKIGYTTKEVPQRLDKWESQCKHAAIEQYRSEVKISNVRRVEKLIHADLKDCRYCEICCPGCRRKHKEWFKPQDAQRINNVIEKWTRWMRSEPYEEVDGVWQLRPDMKAICEQVVEREMMNKRTNRKKGSRPRQMLVSAA